LFIAFAVLPGDLERRGAITTSPYVTSNAPKEYQAYCPERYAEHNTTSYEPYL
jgi:hypothetical protein